MKGCLVIGEGFGAVQASLDLSRAGCPVYLVTADPGLAAPLKRHYQPPGGYAGRLAEKKIVELRRSPLVEILHGWTVESFTGSGGDFTAELLGDGDRRRVKVGAALLAGACQPFDARLKGEYGYGLYPNVVTTFDLERLIGPEGGPVTRPSDDRVPERIAFIQCVGSRDPAHGASYCSAVCCMYSAKEAWMIRQRQETRTDIYYIDTRAYGRDYQRYVDWAKGAGVRYLRGLVSEVREDPVDRRLLLVRPGPEGPVEEVYDMVVLAAGLRPPAMAGELATKMGFSLNEHGFVAVKGGATDREGVFAGAGMIGPANVMDDIASASAAASAALAYMGRCERSKTDLAAPSSSRGEGIGLALCRCDRVKVDAGKLCEAARRLEGVRWVGTVEDGCSAEGLKEICKAVREQGLGRLVVGGCSPRVHREHFRKGLEPCLNPGFVEVADLGTADEERARGALAAKTAMVREARAFERKTRKAVSTVLVIGGGAAGMSAAVDLSRQGIPVVIVEKGDRLGGNLLRLSRTVDGQDAAGVLKDMLREIEAQPGIRLELGAEVVSFEGQTGDFNVVIKGSGGGTESVRCGAIIVATGAVERKDSLQGERISSGARFERDLGDHAPVRRVVFEACAGSLQKEGDQCSRVCCGQTVKNALRAARAGSRVTVLYRDLRTYGFLEDLYEEARKEGVVFIPYDEDSGIDLVQGDDGVTVTVIDSTSGERLAITADLYVRALGLEPSPGASSVAEQLRLHLAPDGFPAPDHIKSDPIRAAKEGVFLAGSGLGPKFLDEAVLEGRAAAAGAAGVVLGHLANSTYAEVDPDRCAACLTCVRVCPYGIPRVFFENQAAYIDPVACRGCGMCLSECPARAITLGKARGEDMVEGLKALIAEVV